MDLCLGGPPDSLPVPTPPGPPQLSLTAQERGGVPGLSPAAAGGNGASPPSPMSPLVPLWWLVKGRDNSTRPPPNINIASGESRPLHGLHGDADCGHGPRSSSARTSPWPWWQRRPLASGRSSPRSRPQSCLSSQPSCGQASSCLLPTAPSLLGAKITSRLRQRALPQGFTLTL